MKTLLTPEHSLPTDSSQAVLVVKVWIPGKGAVLGKLTPEAVIDLSPIAKTSSELFELEDLWVFDGNCSSTLLHLDQFRYRNSGIGT